jgi:hypothetical protein
MKNYVLLSILTFGLFSATNAQLKAKVICNSFFVDILDGRVNDVRCDFSPGQIKDKFPCFTSVEPDSTKCGGAVIYKDRDVKFYTGRDYVEIGPNFKGKMSIPLLGTKRGSLFKTLGLPRVKDDTWDAYTTQYGCLILYYDKAGKVNKIRFSSKNTDQIQLCE